MRLIKRWLNQTMATRSKPSTHGPEQGPAWAPAVLAQLLLASTLGAGLNAMAADDTAGLRAFIGLQVGGIDKLKVPATNAEIPLPKRADGTVDPRIELTEAKRFLGKMLFHDPVRTVRINKNQGQPVDLPVGTAFGGTVSASDPSVQKVIDATTQTGSCGSCHIGEAGGKAGQQLNFNVGGEGRGYTDAHGDFVPRRRVQSILTPQRTQPIFPGDVLVDALPTLTDIDSIMGVTVVANPSVFYHVPTGAPQPLLLKTGRLDELDSVGRMSPAMVGAAFNNRLLLGGFAGEPRANPGSLNPFDDPAQENLTLLLLDAHRMISFEDEPLQHNDTFVTLFRAAFPTEAAQADATGSLNPLINNETVFRATASFLRTVVTRNTPFDHFLAGDDHALTPAQKRGAKLFFTPAANGGGGAGCFSCHSGPMLNKQADDPDVTGVGAYVEKNFFNIGIGDHPVQALNALARGHLDPARLGSDGYPYHAEDIGRAEVTLNPLDRFKFRVLTVRQLKGERNFLHNGALTKVRDVVAYFNAGIPQDPTAGQEPTLSTRFTNPRGPGYPRGLGLTEQQVNDLTDFLENGLYDEGLVTFDPNSSTDTLQPNVRDLSYSVYHPELSKADRNLQDGLMPSGLAIDDNDPLARRDQGLEFLDVTAQATLAKLSSTTKEGGESRTDTYQVSNTSDSVIDTHLLIVVQGLAGKVKLSNASGITRAGDPYLRVFLPNGVLAPGASITRTLTFAQESHFASPGYTLKLLSGQGKP